MNFTWETLVEALRDELKEYGAMRNILDAQQKAIFERSADKVAEMNFAINAQIEHANKVRKARQLQMETLAVASGLSANATLLKLRDVFPEAARPLLKALSDEINSMVDVLRRRTRQNQMLLARTCETMERTLRMMRPDAFTKTYSSRGSIALQMGPVAGHMQAAG